MSDYFLTSLINSTEGNKLDEVHKSDFVQQVIQIYNNSDLEGLKNFYTAFRNFAVRGKRNEESKNEAELRAKRYFDFVALAADLSDNGKDVLNALRAVNNNLLIEETPGPIRQFYHDAVGYKIVNLPFHRNVYNGAVYARDWKIPTGDGQTIDLKSLIILGRYKIADEEEFLRSFQKKIIELDGIAINDPEFTKKDLLEKKIISYFPDDYRKKIAADDTNFMDYLKSQLQFDERGKDFLEVRYSYLLEEFIRINQKHIKGPNWFRSAPLHPEVIKGNLGEQFRFMIPFTGSLSGREEMAESLPDFLSEEESAGLVSAVYDGIKTSEDYQQVFDINDFKLYEGFSGMVDLLGQDFAEEKVERERIVQEFDPLIYLNKKPTNLN